jgi:hypothetical protein
MRKISSTEAMHNFAAGKPFTSWAEGPQQAGHREPLQGNAGTRVFSKLFYPKLEPKFSLDRQGHVFTTGSCFARNVERALVAAGIDVVNAPSQLGVDPGFLNRYNAFAIWQEFDMALESGYDESLCVWANEKPSKWIDYTSYGAFPTKEELLAVRLKILDSHKRIADCGLLILTLGLVEAWYDKELGKYLNITPSDGVRKEPERYECHVLDYNDNVEFVERVVSLVRRRSPGLRIMMTVSPVPLVATFSGPDVAVRNAYSKCTLRSVADHFTSKYDFVDYFPSYEMVMLTAPEFAWLPDRRHVRRELIAEITSLFVKTYIS